MPDYDRFRALLGNLKSGVKIYQRGVMQDYLPEIIRSIIDTQRKAAVSDVARNAIRIIVAKIKDKSLRVLQQKLSAEMRAQFIA
jgi:hypothetical protein